MPGESRPVPWSAARAVPVLASPDRPGLAGTFVGLNLSGADGAIGRLSLACLAVSGIAAFGRCLPGVMGLRVKAAQRHPRLRRVVPAAAWLTQHS